MQQEDWYGTQINSQPLKPSSETKLHELIYPTSNMNTLPMNMKKTSFATFGNLQLCTTQYCKYSKHCVNKNKLVIIS